MKKWMFGMVLFLCGAVGFLVLSLFLASNQYNYNGMTGTYAALLGNELLVPYFVFCGMGIAGLIIGVYEAFFRK